MRCRIHQRSFTVAKLGHRVLDVARHRIFSGALWADNELAGAIVSSHYYLYEIDQAIIEPQFLEYFLKSGQPEFDIQQFVQGSLNYAAIRAYQFPELSIPLPPLDEQRRIVAKLDALAARVEQALALQRAAIEAREQWLMASMKAIFAELVSVYGQRPLKGLFSFRYDLIRPKDKVTGEMRFIGLQHIEPHTGRRIGANVIQVEENGCAV